MSKMRMGSTITTIPELIPAKFTDCEGQMIVPYLSIQTVYDGNSFFLDEFLDRSTLIEQIYGNGLDVESGWNTTQDNIRWLLDVFEEPPIVIERNLRPLSSRNNRQVYFKSNMDSSKIIKEPVGVCVNLENNTITRLGAAQGKSIDDFYNILPWAGMRRCCLRDEGVVDRYFHEMGYVDDGTKGQCMVEIPMFYYKRVPTKVVNNSLVIWEDWVSYKAVNGFFVHPAFVRNDGTIRDKIYIGAYKASKDTDNNIFSIRCDSVNIALPINEVRPYVQKRNPGWELYSITHHSLMQLIYIIASASFDSQQIIGSGDYTSFRGTGKTSKMGSTCGVCDSAVNVFGVENLWSYQGTILDGLFINDNTYINTNGPASTTNEMLSFTLPKYSYSSTTDKRYTNRFGYDAKYDFLYLTSEAVASDNPFIPDVYISNNSLTNKILSVGFNADSVLKDQGLFLNNLYDPITVKASWLGYRICYLP